MSNRKQNQVLVIDQNPCSAQQLEAILRRAGFSPVTRTPDTVNPACEEQAWAFALVDLDRLTKPLDSVMQPWQNHDLEILVLTGCQLSNISTCLPDERVIQKPIEPAKFDAIFHELVTATLP